MNHEQLISQQPRLIAWEMTRNCNLNCVHCRAASGRGPFEGELTTAECLTILDQIMEVGKPIVILSGGEPLLRPDIFELAAYGTRLGLQMVMASNGTLLTSTMVAQIKSAGIKRVSISLDGADARAHDRFRNVPGAFQAAKDGIKLLQEAGIDFQINTTITRQNVSQVGQILSTAVALRAVAHHIFLLVPTGRAKEMKDQEIDAEEYEQLLHWFFRKTKEVNIHLKATCAPHYYRVLRQEARLRGETVDYATYGLDAVTRGCLGGIGFCFISHQGLVQPCGYLEVPCGNLRKKTFGEIWQTAEVFKQLRDFSQYHGKCGQCEYKKVCGGCRARAFAKTGDFLDPEPLCTYQPL